jgi:hypothetical protein
MMQGSKFGNLNHDLAAALTSQAMPDRVSAVEVVADTDYGRRPEVTGRLSKRRFW